MSKPYDYLIVGAGLFGSVFAHEAAARGYRCLVVERRDHIGGNLYCEEKDGIRIHCYGAHIFHTGNPEVWAYICQFAQFNHYINSPIANYHGEIYNLPFNMNTFAKLWNIRTPQEAYEIISQQRNALSHDPQNLEEQAISLVGTDIYHKLIQGYTEKQWGRPCDQLPASIIRRLPVRFTYDNNYFSDRWQGIPIGGYQPIFTKLLDSTEVWLNTDYLGQKSELDAMAENVLYTGAIDAYYRYAFGPLAYRSVRFETQRYETENLQGVAVMNYTDRETPYTRTIEHKHFEFGTQKVTYLSREYSEEWDVGVEPYYPVRDRESLERFEKYQALSAADKTLFGGRLGEYQYYDMDKTILSALHLTKKVLATSK